MATAPFRLRVGSTDPAPAQARGGRGAKQSPAEPSLLHTLGGDNYASEAGDNFTTLHTNRTGPPPPASPTPFAPLPASTTSWKLNDSDVHPRRERGGGATDRDESRGQGRGAIGRRKWIDSDTQRAISGFPQLAAVQLQGVPYDGPRVLSDGSNGTRRPRGLSGRSTIGQRTLVSFPPAVVIGQPSELGVGHYLSVDQAQVPVGVLGDGLVMGGQ